MKKRKLTVHMLGEFYITTESGRFPREVKKSTQLIILIAYLIMHRKESVTKAELIDVLWPNDISENPEGALRNLIYRARKELGMITPGDDIPFILSKGNMYVWNNEVDFDLDVIRLESLCKRIEKEENTTNVMKLCEKLLNEHSQDFMREFRDEQWVVLQKNHYSELVMQTMTHAANKFIEQEAYDSVIALCERMDFMHMLSSDLHERKLYSYYKLNQVSIAISYYHKVLDVYYGRFGIEVSEGIQLIYQKLMEESMGNAHSADDLMKELSAKSSDCGTFYCDFEVFRNVYCVNVRAAKRNVDVGYLVLMELVYNASTTDDEKLQTHSAIVGDIIRMNLRQNDVYSRCSPTKYTLIIDATDDAGCVKALDRIVEIYNKKRKGASLRLVYDYKKIM